MITSDKSKWRADFPLLFQRVRNKPYVYLDSAASALKPWAVIEKVGHFLTYQSSNVHRGAHYLSNEATNEYENARAAAARFLGANEPAEIIFTRGTTESLNLVAQSYGGSVLKPGDEILLTEMEHHSNIVPWQLVAERTGAVIKVIPVNARGELDLQDLEKLITERTKIVSATQCSNTLGTINDLSQISRRAKEVGAVLVVDGAQMVSFAPVNVQEIGADFYAFSGHKLFGPYGVGVLYGRKELLDKMPPYQGGGSMIDEVRFEKTTYHDVPHRFEAGTPNIEGVLGLNAAFTYLQAQNWSEMEEHELSLRRAFEEKLREIPGISIVGEARSKAAITSFNLEGAHASDVGQILDQENIAVRAGHHCTQPLMRKLGIPATVRASFSIYNQMSDVDALVKAILKAKEMFK